jgi:RNA polymerase sigma factor for flagellar operon FliA
MADLSNSEPRSRSLWDDFIRSRDVQLRSELIELYMPLARRMAARVYGYRGDESVTFSDYLQYARVGLIEAVDRFDANRGVPFESYSLRRIRGAILNGIGQESENAAQRRFWRTHTPERLQSLVEHNGGNPQRASLNDLAQITVGIALGIVLDDAERELAADDTPGNNPYAAAELEQFSRRLRLLIEDLPPRERDIIKGHYFERVEFQDIAARLGVTKGRVSQLHAQALARLRDAAADRPRLNRRL